MPGRAEASENDAAAYERPGEDDRMGASPKIGADEPARQRMPRYNACVLDPLATLWEASQHVCAKRLKPLLPVLLSALERHGRIRLEPDVRAMLAVISTATIDRVLRQARQSGSREPRLAAVLGRKVFRPISVDWIVREPGYMAMHLWAHGGPASSAAGGDRRVRSLSATDLFSGWTQYCALRSDEPSEVLRGVERLRGLLPFTLRGLAFCGLGALEPSLTHHFGADKIALTRLRILRAREAAGGDDSHRHVVPQFTGSLRLEGESAFEALDRLYGAMQPYGNFFDCSFRLEAKQRVGARVIRRHCAPETPANRLLACGALSPREKEHLRKHSAALDPLVLIEAMRAHTSQLILLAAGSRDHPGPARHDGPLSSPDCTASQETTSQTAGTSKRPRPWRTHRDIFEQVWADIESWLSRDPGLTGRALLERLRSNHPGVYRESHLRSLQRRLKSRRSALSLQDDGSNT